MIDYINSNRFADLATLKYHPQSGFVITNEWKKNSIIFTKPDHINQLFNEIRFLPYKYILITHSSDYPIDQARFNSKPDNIVHWFGVNATYNHPDLTPIPLGFETHKTEYGMLRGEGADQFDWFVDNIDRLRNIPKDNETVFASFKIDYHFGGNNVWTNPHRKIILPTLDANGLKYYRPQEKIPYKEYLDVAAKYKFHIVPIGNGVDNHRTPELLYMGCIPIVTTNRIYRDWDLPIIQMNSWDQLTNEFLADKLKKIEERFDLSQIEFPYWKNKILNQFKKI